LCRIGITGTALQIATACGRFIPESRRTGRTVRSKQPAAKSPAPRLGSIEHRSITSTAVYTALAPNRFKDFWRD
jgi:hypothetical protein